MFDEDFNLLDTAAEAAAAKAIYLAAASDTGKPIFSDLIARADITKFAFQAYTARVAQVSTLNLASLASSKEYEIVIVFKDDLRLIPNRQTRIVIQHITPAGATVTTEIDKIVTAINADKAAPYVTASRSSNSLVLTAKFIATKSIDKYEFVQFSASASLVGSLGEKTLVSDETVSTAATRGSGLPIQVRELEFQAQGWSGITDLRDFVRIGSNPSFFASDDVTGGGYDLIVIQAQKKIEGSIQDTRTTPIGVIVALAAGSAQEAVDGVDTVIGLINAFVAGDASATGTNGV